VSIVNCTLCRLAADARPAIFELRDLNDNLDLQRVAGRLLAMITSITPSLDLIDPLMSSLISILQDSKVS
jgi:proteasome activator subunit 4